MTKEIEELAKRREEIWKELKEKRFEFDEEWRQKHKDHNCNTKVYAYNGEWFCRHLTEARNRKFKDLIQEEENIVVEITNSAF